MLMTHRLATFTGCVIPVLGWGVLAADVAQISYEATLRFNPIVIKRTGYGQGRNRKSRV